MKPADAKLQRWIDLLAALLSHRFGVTFADLKRLIPAYGAAKSDEALERMFERDKDELRAIGLPINVRDLDTETGTEQRYYMKGREMYLPFLTLAARAARGTPVPPEGYRDVPTIVFEPDELSMLVRAARCARQADDPALTRDADAAIRKLTYDLGAALGATIGESLEDSAPAPDPRTAPVVSSLGEALLRRKAVTFTYHSINRDAIDERQVEPYGLAFVSGHWYMIGRDVAGGALRKFRVSRMQRLHVNTKKPQSTDYEIPGDFDLAAHARAKEPWELGEEPAQDMIVEVVGGTGASEPVRSLGDPVAGFPDRRCFRVRRADSFVRWIMSFAGDVTPISPPALVEHHRSVASATLSLYGAP